MLLPSALSCDASRRNAPPARYPSAALFASPPNSPPSTTQPSSTLFATCRTLQAMLSAPTQLPTPTMAHAPTPDSFKLRLRSRKANGSEGETTSTMPRKKIVKRNAPPRGINKRRRALDDDASRDVDADEGEDDGEADAPTEATGPSTPKRMRLTPEILPMGLERSDFLTLQEDYASGESKTEGEGGEETWTDEDDRVLVELVLEKMKLSKSDWQDCARSLGKDRGSVGRRWKSLMGAGDVGLKRPRRSKIHGTWR